MSGFLHDIADHAGHDAALGVERADIGLIGPVARDESSGHRRYGEEDLDTVLALACLRAIGVGIDDMRTYQANRLRGRVAAGEQRDFLLRHLERIEKDIVTLQTHRDYLRAKAELWDARDRDDVDGERAAWEQMAAFAPLVQEVAR